MGLAQNLLAGFKNKLLDHNHGGSGDGGSLNAPLVNDYIALADGSAAPSTPGAGTLRLYAKTDHAIYSKNSSGVETALGGGGGGSGLTTRLAVTTSGLLYYINFANYPDQVLPNAANGSTGPDGWYVHNTNDQGTWEIANGLLMPTTNGSFDRCRRDSSTWLNAVYEYGMWRNATTAYIGGRQAVGTNADYDQLIRNQEWQVDYAAAGTYGQSISQGAAIRTLANLTNRHRLRINWTGSQRLLSNWEDKKWRLNAFLSSQGPTTAGGIGAMTYQSTTACGLIDYAVFSTTIVTVAGLSSGDGFQLFDVNDQLIGSSGAVSSGSATLDLSPNGSNALCDQPFIGYIQAYTDQGTWSALKTSGRYPAAGNVAVWGGTTYTYT